MDNLHTFQFLEKSVRIIYIFTKKRFNNQPRLNAILSENSLILSIEKRKTTTLRTESKLGTRLQCCELNTGKDTVPHRGGHSKAFPVRAIDELPRARDNGPANKGKNEKVAANGEKRRGDRRREKIGGGEREGEKKEKREEITPLLRRVLPSRLQSDANQTRTHGMEV